MGKMSVVHFLSSTKWSWINQIPYQYFISLLVLVPISSFKFPPTDEFVLISSSAFLHVVSDYSAVLLAFLPSNISSFFMVAAAYTPGEGVGGEYQRKIKA